MAKGGMRDKMPVVTAWIDGLREAFGAEYIDGIIRAGMKGRPVFYASENGHVVGTPVPVGKRAADYVDPDAGKSRYELRNEHREHINWGKNGS